MQSSAVDAIRTQLFADAEDGAAPADVPYLAHYTTTQTAEAVLKDQCVWMAHPNNMNDYEELRFGLNLCRSLVWESQLLEAASEKFGLADGLRQAIDACYQELNSKGAFDLYLFCLSEHERPADDEGRLTMWRAYGSNGDGVALVLRMTELQKLQGLPLILSKVHYLTRDQRRQWLVEKIESFATAVTQQPALTAEELFACAHYFIERVLMFSLFTKHEGFHEEKEWRVLYDKRRDPDDKLAHMLGYHHGPSGLEPKLKLRLRDLAIDGDGSPDLDTLVEQIILGPSHNDDLKRMTFNRMLKDIGRAELSSRLAVSTIPFRGRR